MVFHYMPNEHSTQGSPCSISLSCLFCPVEGDGVESLSLSTVSSTLQAFMEGSTLGEYHTRLVMLLSFHCHLLLAPSQHGKGGTQPSVTSHTLHTVVCAKSVDLVFTVFKRADVVLTRNSFLLSQNLSAVSYGICTSTTHSSQNASRPKSLSSASPLRRSSRTL